MTDKKLDFDFNPFDDEEKELIRSLEQGDWKPVSDFEKRKAEMKAIARNTSFTKKEKRITIRISEADLELLQNIAIHEGIPYQTLIGSVLHKFVDGSLLDKHSMENVLRTLLKSKQAS